MVNRLRPLLAALILVSLVQCQVGNGPTNPIVGGWEIRVDPSFTGKLAPDTFTVSLAQSGGGYAATLPTLTWKGHETFDSAQTFLLLGDTLRASTHVQGANPDTCVMISLLLTGSPLFDSLGGMMRVVNQANAAGACFDSAKVVMFKLP